MQSRTQERDDTHAYTQHIELELVQAQQTGRSRRATSTMSRDGSKIPLMGAGGRKPIVAQPTASTLGLAAATPDTVAGSQCECGDDLAKCLLCAAAPISIPLFCGHIVTVGQQTEQLMFRWGKYESTLMQPGLHFNNCFGRTSRTVATTIQSMDLPRSTARSTIIDASGNPLVVSGVVVYQIVDTFRAAVLTQNYLQFIETQGESVLKSVIARFPYESQGDNPNLQRNSDLVCQALHAEIQGLMEVAGVRVHSFRLKEISYAPVIAAAMLKRQQAQALVEARQTIVMGAVDMSTSAVDSLKERGVVLTDEAKSKLVANLLTVICSESEVQPTLPLQQ